MQSKLDSLFAKVDCPVNMIGKEHHLDNTSRKTIRCTHENGFFEPTPGYDILWNDEKVYLSKKGFAVRLKRLILPFPQILTIDGIINSAKKNMGFNLRDYQSETLKFCEGPIEKIQKPTIIEKNIEEPAGSFADMQFWNQIIKEKDDTSKKKENTFEKQILPNYENKDRTAGEPSSFEYKFPSFIEKESSLLALVSEHNRPKASISKKAGMSIESIEENPFPQLSKGQESKLIIQSQNKNPEQEEEDLLFEREKFAFSILSSRSLEKRLGKTLYNFFDCESYSFQNSAKLELRFIGHFVLINEYGHVLIDVVLDPLSSIYFDDDLNQEDESLAKAAFNYFKLKRRLRFKQVVKRGFLDKILKANVSFKSHVYAYGLYNDYSNLKERFDISLLSEEEYKFQLHDLSLYEECKSFDLSQTFQMRQVYHNLFNESIQTTIHQADLDAEAVRMIYFKFYYQGKGKIVDQQTRVSHWNRAALKDQGDLRKKIVIDVLE